MNAYNNSKVFFYVFRDSSKSKPDADTDIRIRHDTVLEFWRAPFAREQPIHGPLCMYLWTTRRCQRGSLYSSPPLIFFKAAKTNPTLLRQTRLTAKSSSSVGLWREEEDTVDGLQRRTERQSAKLHTAVVKDECTWTQVANLNCKFPD